MNEEESTRSGLAVNSRETLEASLAEFVEGLVDAPQGHFISGAGLREDLAVDSLQWLELTHWLTVVGVPRKALEASRPRTFGDLQILLGSIQEHSSQPESDTSVRGASLPRPIRLGSHNIILGPVNSDSHRFLYQLAISEEISHRWRFRGAIPTFDAFQHGIQQGVLTQFVAYLRPTLEPIGHVVSYNYDQRRGSAYVAAAFTPGAIAEGLPMEAVDLFVDHLFQVYGPRKLYAELPEYNFASIASGRGKWYDVEGCLREAIYYDGRYWDEYIIAVWPKHRKLTPLAAEPRILDGDSELPEPVGSIRTDSLHASRKI